MAILLVFAQVTGGFSGASADATRLDENTISLELSVLTAPGGSVVAHLIDPGGVQTTVAMSERSSGSYRAVIDVAPIDFVVVFEAVTFEPYQSNPLRLTEMGVDPSLLVEKPVFPEAGLAEPRPAEVEPNRWGWLALGFGALSLAALALWVGMGGSKPDQPALDDESVSI